MINRLLTDVIVEEAQSDNPPDNLISVAVSLYNYARFLPECLTSIAAQTYPALELIVVDDCSVKDDSVSVAKIWLQAHRDRFWKVSLLRHVRNRGLGTCRNTGFGHARGERVFVIDADNMLYPRAIQRLHLAMCTSGAAAAFTQSEWFGEAQGIGAADVWEPERLKFGNYIDAMALVFWDAWKRVGGYTPVEGGWEDYDFWCRFVEHGYVAAFVPEVLFRYRVHQSSMLRTTTPKLGDALRTMMALRHPWTAIKE